MKSDLNFSFNWKGEMPECPVKDSERIQEVLDHNWSKLKEWGAFSAIIHHNKRGEPVIVVLAFNGTDVSSFPKTLDGFDLFVSLGEIREQRNE